jgi:hypothetical protein
MDKAAENTAGQAMMAAGRLRHLKAERSITHLVDSVVVSDCRERGQHCDSG